jgi:hypothetical protein
MCIKPWYRTWNLLAVALLAASYIFLAGAYFSQPPGPTEEIPDRMYRIAAASGLVLMLGMVGAVLCWLIGAMQIGTLVWKKHATPRILVWLVLLPMSFVIFSMVYNLISRGYFNWLHM